MPPKKRQQAKGKGKKKAEEEPVQDASTSGEESDEQDATEGFALECQTLFKSTNLYEILGLNEKDKENIDAATGSFKFFKH